MAQALRSLKTVTKIVKARNSTSRQSNMDPYLENLLKNVDDGKSVVRFEKDGTVFSQGDAADSIFFIQAGKVKITVVSSAGKEAVLAMLGPRSSLGEGCLVGQTLRIGTATAIQSSTLYRIERRAMLRALHAQPELSEKFIALIVVPEHRFGRGPLRSALQP